MHTGSGAHRHSNPFYRHFGPDLTGIFTADTGAFGIKTKITLRLIDTPAVTLNASFGFATIEAMLDVQIQLARKRIASERYGFDPFYNEVMKGLGFNFEPTKPGSAKPGQIKFTLTSASMPSIRLEAFSRKTAKSARVGRWASTSLRR